MVVIEGKSLLPGLEKETLAEFEQECLKLGDDGPFKIGLGVGYPFIHAQELQH
jgi:hypothetical protein